MQVSQSQDAGETSPQEALERMRAAAKRPENPPKVVYPFSEDKAKRGPFLPFSQILVDEVMPIIGPNSWCVLCFIIRKTNGFNKGSDWISYGQIQEGTGISGRDTISKALRELQGFRPIKDGSKILGWERVESLPQLIKAHRGKRNDDGTLSTSKYSLNRDVKIHQV